ncbi:MAG: MFS transporter [Desulfobacteraceae bacterium]|nr:MAG: MFS transporter [Desulfobacteraceae bacterium]
MQIPSGILADSWGPRRTITMGCVVSAFGSVLFGLAHTLPMAYVGRFLVGLGVSVIFIPILKIITEWFDRKRFAAMSGITLLVGNAGALLAATPLAIMADRIGWRAASERENRCAGNAARCGHSV